jgi:hypothetical protein
MNLQSAFAAAVCAAALLAPLSGARAEWVYRSEAAKAAKLAYVVAQNSPILGKAAKRAISQNYHGAPIAGKPRVHRVLAKDVYCRGLNQATPDPNPSCEITYAARTGEKKIVLRGEEAAMLDAGLAAVGVEPDAAMGHAVRQLMDLRCTVDDDTAQGTSSSGDEINGFACTFQAEQFDAPA